jgi:hypothetical protein
MQMKVDIRESDERVLIADLAIDPIPFEDSFFDYYSAFDFIMSILAQRCHPKLQGVCHLLQFKRATSY